MFDQSVQLREAGRREGGDRVRQVRGRQVPLQAAPLPHVRVHDQLHPQAEAPAREVHDELSPGKLHNSTGK